MSNIEQCFRCKLDNQECGYYDHTVPTACMHFVRPLDNSRMFARWNKFSGRIGRREYALTLVISILLCVGVTLGVGVILGLAGVELNSWQAWLVGMLCLVPGIVLAIAAGFKRTNDTGVSHWFAWAPILPLFVLNIFVIMFSILGCMYLLKDKGEDGINQHGSNPAQPYEEQLQFELAD